MSGNGAQVVHPGIALPLPPYPDVILPSANGGGCIYSGPFKHMSVNLGPVALPGTPYNPNGLAYNPRYLKRDINPYISQQWTEPSDIPSLIQDNKDINSFQMSMQGVPGSAATSVSTADATTPSAATPAETSSLRPATQLSTSITA